MSFRSARLLAACAGLALLGLGAPALAAGSSSDSAPSASVPRYDPAAEYAKAVEALKAGEHAKAALHLERVLDAAPGDANANYLMGLAKKGLGENKLAKRYFAKAVRNNPEHIQARQELGVVLARLGEAEKAKAQLHELVLRQDGCADKCENAAALDAAVRAVGAAIMGEEEASLALPGPLVFASAAIGDRAYLDAVGLINEARYEEAIAQLKKAEEAFGPHPDVLTYLGYANRKLARFGVAEDYYHRALAAAPEHKGATEYLGELKVEQGKLDEAKRLLARLEGICAFGCAEAEELRRWIAAAPSQG